MATKKKTGTEAEAAGEDTLKKAAKAIGSVIGAVAAKVGVHVDTPKTPPRKKIGKLVKKDKKRLPRKDKKLAKKVEAAKKA